MSDLVPIWRVMWLGLIFGLGSLVAALSALWPYPWAIILELVVSYQEVLIGPVVMTALHGAVLGWASLVHKGNGLRLLVLCVVAAVLSLGLEESKNYGLLHSIWGCVGSWPSSIHELGLSAQSFARSVSLALALAITVWTGSFSAGTACYWGCLVTLGLARESSRVPQLVLAGLLALALAMLSEWRGGQQRCRGGVAEGE